MADFHQTRSQAIQDFQQRLVLLYHASTCLCSNAQPRKPCRASPRCYDYVQLLRHCQSCEHAHCIVPHCVSTRYLLAHRSECQSEDCIICKPLRESIERKQSRERKVVKISSLRSRADFETSSEEISESSSSTPRSIFSESSPYHARIQLRTGIQCQQEERGQTVGPPRVESWTASKTHVAATLPSESISSGNFMRPPPINIPTQHFPRNLSQASPSYAESFRGQTPRAGEGWYAGEYCASTSDTPLPTPKHAFEVEEEIGFETMMHFLATESLHEAVPEPHTITQFPGGIGWNTVSAHQPNLSPVSETSEITMCSSPLQFNCVKCRMTMVGGYRYSCEHCQISFCACCFHNVDSIPHPHPLRPHLIAGSS